MILTCFGRRVCFDVICSVKNVVFTGFDVFLYDDFMSVIYEFLPIINEVLRLVREFIDFSRV